MAENTKIEWTATYSPDGSVTPGKTFNPWRGCTKISAGCAQCYAETLSHRNPGTLGVWGPQGTRVVASEAQWRLPLKWDREAAKAGVRHRVFCASLADVFEDWKGPMSVSDGRVIIRPYLDTENVPNNWQMEFPDVFARDPQGWKSVTMGDVRARLFQLILDTPNLDWLILTKRPENFARFLPWVVCSQVTGVPGAVWPNVWLGVSVENQAAADERIPHLLKVPARVRFLSCEPLLGPVDLSKHVRYSCRHCKSTMTNKPSGYGNPFVNISTPLARAATNGWMCSNLHFDWAPPGIHWVIVGGESGHGARPMRIEWARSLVAQCKAAGVACFVKQMGSKPTLSYYTHDVDIREQAMENDHTIIVPDHRGEYHEHNDRDGQPPPDAVLQLNLRDRKGGDIEEFPADLKVRQFPEAIA